MITILVNNLNAMIVTSSETVMQHSKNAHIVRIFVPKTYYSFDMEEFTASIEIVPPSQKYVQRTLSPAETSVKEGYVQYDMEIDSEFTLFSGDIEMEMTFIKVDSDTQKTFVRHTSSCSIPVTAIENWAQLITDDTLTELDQRLALIESGIATTAALVDAVNMNKADNVALNSDGDLQLKSNGNFIGDAVHVAIPSTEDDEDGNTDGIVDLSVIYEEI